MGTENATRSRAKNRPPNKQQRQKYVNDETVFSELNSATHGRERRAERNIQKIDLQRAKKYGICEHQSNGRDRYTYGGIVFIHDPYQDREVTSWTSPDFASQESGTKAMKPILLQKKSKFDTEQARLHHCLRRTKIFNSHNDWRSHTVIVVDMSGSMRRDDVQGAKCRSDAVWLTMARDVIRPQLQSGKANEYDLVSVVVMMNETASLLMRCEPMDWVLYNQFIQYREWDTLRPAGRGNYGPALALVHKLFKINPLHHYALSLLFVSDGRPSDIDDSHTFGPSLAELAKLYRRRLAVTCVGMAQEEDGNKDSNASFRILNEMVTGAQSYGAMASFHKPLLETESLSKIMTSFASALTLSKTELTSVKTGTPRQCKLVLPERHNAPDDDEITDEWKVYSNSGKDDGKSQQYVRRIWSWSYKRNNFVYLQDPRCVVCYEECVVSTFSIGCGRKLGTLCPHCQASTFCLDCMSGNTDNNHGQSGACYRFLRDQRIGVLITSKKVPSFSVALKIPIFEEGAERMVHKYRYLDQHGHFTGPKMVAKESRFVEEDGRGSRSYRERMEYHREFMRTQALASEFAKKFNSALDNLLAHFDDEYHDWVERMPRIEFLEPLVIEAMEANGEEFNMLVEPMLEGRYVKFNNNMGYVKGQGASSDRNQFMDDLDVGASLGVIEEGSDCDEHDSGGDGEAAGMIK